MSTLVNITINGQKLQANHGQTVLQAARAAGITIPALCDHPHLKPEGACRVCLVELQTPRGGQLVASCSHPVEQNMVVRTDAESVRQPSDATVRSPVRSRRRGTRYAPRSRRRTPSRG